jgi:hypothetical protein
MAMAWIVHIRNTSSAQVTLRQNDPTWHPVINGHQYGIDEPIVVAPGADLRCSYFVVPWEAYGRLEVTTQRGTYTFCVGPNATGTDCLKGRASNDQNPTPLPLGDQGNQFYSPSLEMRLDLSDTGVTFVRVGQGWESVIGSTIYHALKTYFTGSR